MRRRRKRHDIAPYSFHSSTPLWFIDGRKHLGDVSQTLRDNFYIYVLKTRMRYLIACIGNHMQSLPRLAATVEGIAKHVLPVSLYKVIEIGDVYGFLNVSALVQATLELIIPVVSKNFLYVVFNLPARYSL